MKNWIWYIIITLVFTFGYILYKESDTTAPKSGTEETDTRLFASKAEQSASPAEQAEQDEATMANSPHLKFKGVPIDGTRKKFVDRMEKKEFKYIGDTEDGASVLEGDFAAYKGCRIYVSTLENKDLVSRIAVVFPEQKQWEYLYGNYKSLKEMLTEKYGKPASCTEEFQEAWYYASNDERKMDGAKTDKCKYVTRFQADNGEIILSIGHSDSLRESCYVMLTYKDATNGNAVKQHAMDDL